MNFLEKKTLFNTSQYFTKLKPIIAMNVKDKFESRLFSELKIRFNSNQNIFIILFIFFGRCYKQIFKNILNFKK